MASGKAGALTALVPSATDVFAGPSPWGVDLGDVRTRLAEWPDDSVQCVVTSPPYLGLRDYGCDGQIGLEPTPDEYVAEMVGVFRDVRRALRRDGVLWLNVGDSYAGSGRGGYTGNKSGLEGSTVGQDQSRIARGSQLKAGFHEAARSGGAIGRAWVPPPPGLKQKDLIGVPWMLAFALRADGWFLRSDTIWSKPNPMPESTRDRPTKSHEYLFLLTKSSRYYFDSAAIAEEATDATRKRLSQDIANQRGSYRANGGAKANGPMKAVGGGASFGKQRHSANGTGAQSRTYDRPEYLTRNRRSVWTVATQSYKGAHFAVMPPKLVAPCVLAGSRPGDIVADPFAGSGTTLKVAVELGRRAVGVELNPAYLELIAERMAGPAVLTKAKERKPRRAKPGRTLFAGME